MSKNDNIISEKAAQSDSTYRYTGPVEATAVGSSNPKAALAAQSMLATLATGALAVGAAAGFVDPAIAGIAAMSTIASKGKLGWKI